MKLCALWTVPAGVVTLILPEAAPVGTLAVAEDPVPELNVVAATPPNSTAVMPLNPTPLKVTVLPTCPVMGEIRVTDRVGVKRWLL
jgi:hypothetical protein